MTDEIELLKKEYQDSDFNASNLKSFRSVDSGVNCAGSYRIVKSEETGKYFEILYVNNFGSVFTEVERVEETKVVVSWLPA